MKNCDLILPFFVSYAEAKTGVAKPHDGEDGFIYATNLAAAIRVPKESVAQSYDHPDWHPGVKEVFDTALNAPGVRAVTIEQADIIAALDSGGRLPFVKIGAQTFAAHHLRTILAVSLFVEAERLTYRANNGSQSPGLFDVGNGITILLWPTVLRAVRAAEVKIAK